jgi:hypothetical protein
MIQAIHSIENENEYGPVPIWMGVTEIQDFRG